MVDEMDWKAAMSSEIFREYVNNELKKEAAKEADDTRIIREHLANQIRKETSDDAEIEKEITARAQAMADLDAFETKLKQSPALLAKFKLVKAALIANPKLIEKVDPAFIKGIMMLEIE